MLLNAWTLECALCESLLVLTCRCSGLGFGVLGSFQACRCKAIGMDVSLWSGALIAYVRFKKIHRIHKPGVCIWKD